MRSDSAESRNDVSLDELFSIIKRRKTILYITLGVALIVAFLVNILVPNTYRSSRRVLLEGRTQNNQQPLQGDPLSNVAVTPTSAMDVQTQMELLSSVTILSRAYVAAGVQFPVNVDDAARVIVKQVAQTNAVELSVDAPTEEIAEKIAAVLPAEYGNYMKTTRQSEITSALTFLENRLAEEKAKLEEAETALRKFKVQHRVSDTNLENQKRTQKIAQLEQDKINADRVLSGAQARVQRLINERRALPPTIDATSVQSNAAQIDAQKKVIADLEAQREQILTRYLPTSAAVQKIDQEIKKQKEYLASIPKTQVIVTQIRNPKIDEYDLRITEARAAVDDAMAQKMRVDMSHEAEVKRFEEYGPILQEQAKLQRDVEQGIATVARLTSDVDNLSVLSKAVREPVIEMTPSTKAELVSPKPVLNFAIAIFVGLFLSLIFAILRDRTDSRVATTTQIDSLVGANALGYIPTIKRSELASGSSPALAYNGAKLPVVAPTGGEYVLESYRILRSNMAFSTLDAPVHSIMVTSTNAGEGKSFVAYNLATAYAAEGKRVVLVDANMRRPAVHERFGLNATPGLGEVLLGEKTYEQVMQPTGIPGLSIISAGGVSTNTAELIGSDMMKSFHSDLLQVADMVIFDAPSSVRPADAQILSAIVEGVLYVVQLGLPRTADLKYGIHLLKQANAKIVGIVYNRIPVTAQEAPKV